jgi:hypothetical protein
MKISYVCAGDHIAQHLMWFGENGLRHHLHAVLGVLRAIEPTPLPELSYQGFGLTLGSDLFLFLDPGARHAYETAGRVVAPQNLTRHHGHFTALNGSATGIAIPASFGFMSATNFEIQHNIKGMPLWSSFKAIVNLLISLFCPRLLPRSIVAVVSAADSLVVSVLLGADILNVFVTSKPADLPQPTTPSHGYFLLPGLCC